MNYIRHLNGIFNAFAEDERLNPTHISLYMALFHLGNSLGFPREFFINRGEMMKLAKIGSTATYHKCLKDLAKWEYIQYLPSHNRFRGSKIHLFNFQTTPEQGLNKRETTPEQALIPKNKEYINHDKHKKNRGALPKNFMEVFDFLKSSDCAKNISRQKLKKEAQKFFNHYSANGWKIGGKTPMENWKPAAENWMLKAEEFATKNSKQTERSSDHLHTEKSKDYNQPL